MSFSGKRNERDTAACDQYDQPAWASTAYFKSAAAQPFACYSMNYVGIRVFFPMTALKFHVVVRESPFMINQ